MNLFGVMDVSASALRAERVRAEVVASNMANAETTRTPDGRPYQRHHVVFESQNGGGFSQSPVRPVKGGARRFWRGCKSRFGSGFNSSCFCGASDAAVQGAQWA